ncbi:SIP domain-containing protein [Paenarthrobacter ureafaciens]
MLLAGFPASVTERPLAEEVCSSLTAEAVSPEEDFFWVACEASSARAIAKHLRKVVGVDRRQIDVLGYWKA